MTPREFLRAYQRNRRIVDAGAVPSAPLDVDEGATVGVVMMNLGGPRSLEEVEPFLYNLFMDPAIFDLPVGGLLRHWLCRALANVRARSVRNDYELIGGSSPIHRLTREQARALEDHLSEAYGARTDVSFRTYVAMRYGHPSIKEAAAQMEADGVDQVVLLPLYPHYSKTTTGSSLAYWKALEDRNDIPKWPTTTVTEYAANPKYVQALSERIDEGLQRFPREVRSDVHLLFSAYAAPLRAMKKQDDPYCCLVHATVEQVMRHRRDDRSFHTAFRGRMGWSEWLRPSTSETLETLADDGTEAVLVVPITFVTEHLKTSYELDVEVREEAEAMGISQYEVTTALNAHPLFIAALGEATVSQLTLPVDVNQLRHGGDGIAKEYPLRPLDTLPRYAPDARDTRCPNCECVAEARCWHPEPERPVVDAPSADAGGSPQSDAEQEEPSANARSGSRWGDASRAAERDS